MSPNLYDPAARAAIESRITRLRADAPRQWGTMTPAQALAHCARGLEMAVGDTKPRRLLLGRIFGRVAKRSLIDRGEPMRRNAPTDESLVVRDQPDFDAARRELRTLIDRFVSAGPEGCTRHPHLFMGDLTPVEWAALMYQHLDHHLRQFGV